MDVSFSLYEWSERRRAVANEEIRLAENHYINLRYLGVQVVNFDLLKEDKIEKGKVDRFFTVRNVYGVKRLWRIISKKYDTDF